MRYLICLLLTTISLSLFSCDRNDEGFKTWQKSLNLDTGTGVVQNNSGEFLFHSHDQIVKFSKNGNEIWRINLPEQLQEFRNLTISNIQKMESDRFAVLIHGSSNSDDPTTSVSLLILDESGMILTQSQTFSGNNVRGSSMTVHDTGFKVSITEGSENNNGKLVALDLGKSGEVIEEKSYDPNKQYYAVSGASLILKDERGFLLELQTTSATDDELTNRRLIKLDSDLNESWSVDFGGSAFNETHDIVELSSRDFIVAGTYLSQGWVLKIDASGNILWDKKFSDEEPGKQFFFDAVETETGEIMLTGSNNVNGAGADDLWLMNLNAGCEVNWEAKHGTSYYDFGRSVIHTQNRGYAVAGGTQSSFESPIRMWVLKLNSDGKL